MSSHAAPKLDLMREIKVDHDNVIDLRERFDAAHKEMNKTLLGQIATTMIQEASLHSDGEEQSIYRALDEHGLHDVAEHDRADHQKVKQAFYAVDKLLMSVTEPDLDELVKHVREASDIFIAHAKQEEETDYPKLLKKLSEEAQHLLTRDFLKARSLSPTRPHPSAPQHGGIAQTAAGMASKPLDAMIQAWREHVPLKHKHAEL